MWRVVDLRSLVVPRPMCCGGGSDRGNCKDGSEDVGEVKKVVVIVVVVAVVVAEVAVALIVMVPMV